MTLQGLSFTDYDAGKRLVLYAKQVGDMTLAKSQFMRISSRVSVAYSEETVNNVRIEDVVVEEVETGDKHGKVFEV